MSIKNTYKKIKQNIHVPGEFFGKKIIWFWPRSLLCGIIKGVEVMNGMAFPERPL